MSRRLLVIGAAVALTVAVAIPAEAHHETDSWERVVLANPAGPDSLAAGGDVADAPVLFVDRDRLPPETRAELVRRQPHHLIVVGGTAAISNEVVGQAISALPVGGISVSRCAGPNRYATAARCAEDHFPGVRPAPVGALHK